MLVLKYMMDGKRFGRNAILFILIIASMSCVYAAPDIVASNDLNFVFLDNDGSGNFAKKFVFTPETRLPHEIASADFDNDGNYDVALNHWQDGIFTVYWAANIFENLDFSARAYNIEGCIRNGVSVGSVCELHAIGSGDFNEDGYQDLALVDNGQSRGVFIFLSDGKKGFVQHKGDGADAYGRYLISGNIRSIKTDYLNQDEHIDYIVPSYGSSFYHIFFGDGKGNFEVKSLNLAGVNNLNNADTGDIDNDGDTDLVVPNNNDLTILLNDGKGNFEVIERLQKTRRGEFLNVKLADFNNDGVLDIFALAKNGIVSYYGNGAEKECYYDRSVVEWFCIESSRAFEYVGTTNDAEIADFNDDGFLDVALSVYESIARTYINVYYSIDKQQQGIRGVFFSNALGVELGGSVAGGGMQSQAMLDVYGWKPEKTPPVPRGPEFIRGDVDGDGVLTMGDAIKMLNFMFSEGNAPSCLDTADVDDNGVITLGDAVYLLNFMFSGGNAPKEPYRESGIDETEDSITCECYTKC